MVLFGLMCAARVIVLTPSHLSDEHSTFSKEIKVVLVKSILSSLTTDHSI
jgi:hypothetical protein